MPDPVKGHEHQQGSKHKNEATGGSPSGWNCAKGLVAAASAPDPCLQLSGGDWGEVSGSEAPNGQEADTTRVAAQIFGLRDTGTWCTLPPSLLCSTG